MEIREEERNDELVVSAHTEDPVIFEIEKSIKRRLAEARRRLHVQGKQLCTINEVSKILTQENEKCYEPQLVSIGPYHRGKERLKPMEEQKCRYLRDLLSRKRELQLVDIVKIIKELEKDARKCYSESISLESKEFVEVMVFDGCFLVEIFLRVHKEGIKDDMFLKLFITRDMLLLENQLPFSVLESIFSLVVPQFTAIDVKKLILYCLRYIYIMPFDKNAVKEESYHHVLDMLHYHCLPTNRLEKNYAAKSDSGLGSVANADGGSEAQSGPNTNAVISSEADADIEAQLNARCSRLASSRQLIGKWKRKNPEGSGPDATVPQDNEAQSSQDNSKQDFPEEEPFSIRPAEELLEAGVKLEKKVKTHGSFLEVEFDDKKGTLKIPYLYFAVDLQTIFLNLIAFEQCYPEAGTFFSGYALFMDRLVNTAKDVQLLRHAGILEHALGSDEALAERFNELSARILSRPAATYLSGECKAIKGYCRRRWPTWRANLMRNYFNSPWAILSLIAAILLLLLTIAQTVFSIIE